METQALTLISKAERISPRKREILRNKEKLGVRFMSYKTDNKSLKMHHIDG